MRKLAILLITIPFIILNCGKPTEPESITNSQATGGYQVVSKTPTAGNAQDVWVDDSLAYIAQGEGGLIIINIADPESPRTVSVTTTGVRGYSTKVAKKDSAVYLAAGTFGVNVIDVSDPFLPLVTASNLAMKPARNFYVLGDYLFTAISEQGINISDISYAFEPDIRGGMLTPGYARGIFVSADSSLLLAACGEMGMAVFDISDFQQGFGTYPLIDWTDTPGYAEDIVIQENSSTALLACGTAGLQILDFSDTTNVRITGSFDTGGYAKELVCRGNRVYITTELRGLQIIDISDVSTPVLIGRIDTSYALGLDVHEPYIYLADEKEGLIIISSPD